MSEENKPWYSEGLRFKCTECGKCCTGSPGYVWVTESEIESIASWLKITTQEFSKRYLRSVHGRLSLIENKKNYDCIFLKDRKCMVYPVRPKQCQNYPWWPENLKSKESWDQAAKECEGINDHAPLVGSKAIFKILKDYKH